MKFDEWISVTYGEDIKTKDRKLYDRRCTINTRTHDA